MDKIVGNTGQSVLKEENSEFKTMDRQSLKNTWNIDMKADSYEWLELGKMLQFVLTGQSQTGVQLELVLILVCATTTVLFLLLGSF